MITQALAVATGLTLLAATAHVTIAHTGGYHTPHAILTLAIAAGAGVGALAIGQAWTQQRFRLAWILVAALFCGEAYQFLRTGERLVALREHRQAPVRQNQDTYAKATQRLEAAKTALERFEPVSPELSRALAAKRRADAAAIDKSALRGCRRNCRALLEQQVAAAQAAVAIAHRRIKARKASLNAELNSARAALAALPAPISATALADRLQVSAWLLDLIMAALGSFGANGMAVALLTFGAHHAQRQRAPEAADRPADGAAEAVPAPMPVPAATNRVRPRKARQRKAAIAAPMPAPASTTERATDANTTDIGGLEHRRDDHAAQFCYECLVPSDRAPTPLVDIRKAYFSWCQARGQKPLPDTVIAERLADLFQAAGLTTTLLNNDPAVAGITIDLNAIAA